METANVRYVSSFGLDIVLPPFSLIKELKLLTPTLEKGVRHVSNKA